MRRIVVTGASGNIGSAVVRALGSLPDQEVVGLSRRRPPDVAPWAGMRWVRADLADPAARPVVQEAVAGADAVVHLAWGFQPSHDVDYLDRVALEGTSTVLEAVARARVPHLVHMSSLGAYSPKRDDERVDESWPTGGVAGSAYSRQKAAAERLLDAYEDVEGLVLTRLRPGLVVQPAAAGALLRYGVPSWVPAAALGHLPVLPLDRGFAVQLVHADDVADAVVRSLDRRVPGAFNLAAEPVLRRERVADVLGARPVHVPRGVLRALVDLTWRTRVQALDPGWVDLAFAVPTMDTTRARRELGWQPRHQAAHALAGLVAAMARSDGAPGPVLRRRRPVDQAARAADQGTIGARRLP